MLRCPGELPAAYREREVSEFSFGKYVALRSRGHALSRPVPSLGLHAEEAQRRYGQDFWPYGLEPNRVRLEAFVRFAFERLMKIEELFAKTTHKLFQA